MSMKCCGPVSDIVIGLAIVGALTIVVICVVVLLIATGAIKYIDGE